MEGSELPDIIYGTAVDFKITRRSVSVGLRRRKTKLLEAKEQKRGLWK
jgi:hypothetical protein